MSWEPRERREGFLSGNALKVLAALFMVCDHIGMLFFTLSPSLFLLRYIGRVAYPMFAFFIAEGCRYTKNKAKYLGFLAVMGLVFHLFYAIATGDDTINVIVSFALAVCLVYQWQFFVDEVKAKKYLMAIGVFVVMVGYAYLCHRVCGVVHVDYYFGGILLPWLVYLFKNKWLRLGMFSIGIILVCYYMGEFADVEIWGLFAVPIMALYNGKRGTLRMKYFFYVFYPAHLVILYGISLLVLGALS